MKKVRVFRGEKRGKISFESEPEIKEILGSTMIKKPFSVSVPGEIVLAEIKKCNPDHHVYLDKGEVNNRSNLRTILPAIFVSAMVFWWVILYALAKLSQ